MKACIRNILLVGALMLPGFARAQFTFTVYGGEVTITGYNGPLHAQNSVIPDTTNGFPVTAIADFAFQSQHFVTNVVFPSGLASIGQSAFADCRALSSVSSPAGLTNVGRFAFNFYTNLMSITVDAANPVFSSRDGVLFDKAQTTLICWRAIWISLHGADECDDCGGGEHEPKSAGVGAGVDE